MTSKINGNVIALSDNDRIFFSQFSSSSSPVVKRYKADFSKKAGANMYLANYTRCAVKSLIAFDKYLNSLSQFDTITLGLTTQDYGVSKTAKEYRERDEPDFIYRGKEHIKYINDLFPYMEQNYSLYFFDIDFDEAQPAHFKMNTPQEVRDTLVELIPVLKDVEMIIRPSSSANIYNTLTGTKRSNLPSWHIYIIVANSTAQSNANLTEYIKRRAHVTNLHFIKTSASSAILKRFYVDLAVADNASRLIIEAIPLLDYPLAKMHTPSTFYNGGILDLASIDYVQEPKYETVKVSSNSTKNVTTSSVPIFHKGQIIITENAKTIILDIVKYFSSNKRPNTKKLSAHLTGEVVSALLTHLGYEIDSSSMFKLRVTEKTASASIRYDGYIKDFGGSFSGSIINFIMHVYQLGFLDSWKYIQNCFGKRLKLSEKVKDALPSPKGFEQSLTTNSLLKR